VKPVPTGLPGLTVIEPAVMCRVAKGEAFDAVVDVRRGSPTFGKAFTTVLSAANGRLLWVPPGFAHGFVALADDTVFLYKVSAYWSPADERGLAWNDPALAIPWPISAPNVSAKDAAFPRLADLPDAAFPRFQP
jgi:dTDP-4-dehydrorhamnose 3,5-epimerase